MEEPKDTASPIDLGWLKEQLEFLQGKGIEAWSNAKVVSYLNSLTGKKATTVVNAVKALSKEDAERFVMQINEAVKNVSTEQ